jgi:hypothetical protein
MYSHAQLTRTSAHAQGDDANAHAHSNVSMSNRQAWGVIRWRHCWARGFSLTPPSVLPRGHRCSAIALAGPRMSRSEAVHVDGAKVDASSDMFAAVLGGSPAEAHRNFLLPVATRRPPFKGPLLLRFPSGAVRAGAR